ncbi:hypothetical protein ERO13_D11G203250v2 [Gossypium hirsutum]|nr:hypothetical protein ERO13_D11G203250v2 [Gossypium hirsutum]
MQYHALSLSSIQWQKHSHSFPKILHPVMLLLKPIIQFVILLWFLCFKVPPPNAFIVQVRFYFPLERSQVLFLYCLE